MAFSLGRYSRARSRVKKRIEGLGPDALAQSQEYVENLERDAEALREERQGKGLSGLDRELPKLRTGVNNAEGGYDRERKRDRFDDDNSRNNDNSHNSRRTAEDTDGRSMSSYMLNDMARPTIWRPGYSTLSEQEQMEAEFKWYARYYQKPHAVEEEGLPGSWEPEHEGFYMSNKTFYQHKHKESIEARLLREDPERKVFFDEHGQLLFERSPLRAGLFKPRLLSQEYQMHTDTLATKIHVPSKYTAKEIYYGFNVNLEHIQLFDHPLFTYEDYACIKLQRDYDEYMRRETINLVKYYTEQISSLRKLVKKQNKAIEKLPVEDPALVPALEDYSRTLTKIQYARRQRDREDLEQLQLFRHIYDTWKSIQRWRVEKTEHVQSFGFLTGEQYQDTYEEVEEAEAEAEEKEKVNSDPDPEVEASGADQEGKEAAGEDADDSKRSPSKTPPRATKKKKKRLLKVQSRATYVGYPLVLKVKKVSTSADKLQEKASWTEAAETELDERRTLYETKLILADPDHLPDHEQMELWEETQLAVEREQILSRMKRSKRHPGKPRYYPVLDASIGITSTAQCDPVEKQRRRDIDEFRLQIELQVNDKTVMKTEAAGIEFPGFRCTFNTTASLRLLSIPKKIHVNLFRKRLLTKDRLSQIFIPVPELGSAPNSTTFEWSGVGIDVAGLKGFSPDQGRFVEGEFTSACYWEPHENQHDMNTAQVADAVRDFEENWNRQINKSNRALAVKRKRIVEAYQNQRDQIDPNDPRNTMVLEILRREQVTAGKGKQMHAYQFFPELYIVDQRYYQQSIRKKVLRSRVGQPSTMSQKVPLDESQIELKQFDLVHVDKPVLDDLSLTKSMNSGTNSMNYDARNLKQEQLTLQERNREKAKIISIRQEVYDVGEVVKEDDLPTPKFFMLLYVQKFAQMFKPRSRKLQVARKKLKPVANPKKVRIRIQVIKGHNLPLRLLPGGNTEDGSMFLEVAFQSHRPVHTHSRIGADPSWNELVSVPFLSPGESMSPNYLQSCRDEVHFNLFDSVEIEKSTRHEKKQTRNVRWLGKVSIPFTTIYMNGQVEGRFSLEIPFDQLGYTKTYPQEPSSVWLYCTLDPPLVKPPNIARFFRKPSNLSVFCNNWVAETLSEPKMKDRYIEAMVGDIQGDPQLLCTYIQPQEPPEGMAQSPDLFTRFVSQIPFLEDFHHASAGVHEIWCSSREFLTLTYGDWEEHAVLLCNYFKFYEGKESPWSSFVVLGHAVPEGKTSYVLRVFRGADQYGNDRIERAVLYNAVSGETWDVFSDDVSDVDYCPLQRVGCVFDNQNVWANIQNHDNPRDMDFNLNNTNLWKPLKRKEDLSLFEQVQSLQQPVRYFYTDPVYYQERAVQLESLCERAFETWRLGKPLQLSTSWDYSARGVFRDMLATFEQVKQKTSHEPDKSMLAQLNKAYDNIFGFPLNFTEACDPAFMSDNPFENPVLIALRNTRLHEIKETGVQFGLAVHIERYPNKIGSVWLYIAALSPHS